MLTVMQTTTAMPQSCVLPVEPNVLDVEEQGTRFGLDEDSRFEFNVFAGFQSDLRTELRLKYADRYCNLILKSWDYC